METQVGAGAGDLAALAEEGFRFGYPLVLMAAASEGEPTNQLVHDGPAISAWLDLSKEPVVLSVPDASKGDWTISLVSAWTERFAGPEVIASGTRKADFAIVGPNFKGTVPAGVTEIVAPTELVRLLGRIDATDKAQVEALRKALRITPLSAWGKATAKKTDAKEQRNEATHAADAVAQMNGLTFFSKLAQLLVGNPAPQILEPTLMRMQALGMKVGKPFRPDAATRAALDEGVKSGLARMAAREGGAELGDRAREAMAIASVE